MLEEKGQRDEYQDSQAARLSDIPHLGEARGDPPRTVESEGLEGNTPDDDDEGQQDEIWTDPRDAPEDRNRAQMEAEKVRRDPARADRQEISKEHEAFKELVVSLQHGRRRRRPSRVHRS